MIGGERPLLPDILGQNDRVGTKSPIFDIIIFARSASAVTPKHLAKKVLLTLIGSPLRAFQ